MSNRNLLLLVLVGVFLIFVVWWLVGSGNSRSFRPTQSPVAHRPKAAPFNSHKTPFLSQVPVDGKLTPNQAKALLIDLREKAGADPHNAMRWIEIAKVYNNIGDYYKACQYLKKSLEMDPKFKERAAVEEIIEQCDRKYQGHTGH